MGQGITADGQRVSVAVVTHWPVVSGAANQAGTKPGLNRPDEERLVSAGVTASEKWLEPSFWGRWFPDQGNSRDKIANELSFVMGSEKTSNEVKEKSETVQVVVVGESCQGLVVQVKQELKKTKDIARRCT
ncbi:hypothetical protein RRG08_013385 [Elysia crispata]|uniref:Uncharacterized protein n=1 Tax=Elysia crispata TaxID=231223 RepID=A0AAE1B6I8_9GAST|nr:hypothetical protein RRG08_013385 [Elysia crispata]